MLNSFFDYNDDFFKNEFVIVLKFLLNFKDEEIFLNLLSKLDLDEENLVEYIKSKEAIIKYSDLMTSPAKSPSQLQTKSYLWPYYSLYFSFKLFDKNSCYDLDLELKIVSIALEFHLLYLENFTKKNIEDLTYKINDISQMLIRIMEILVVFNKYEELYEIYFDTDKNIIVHFLEVFYSDNNERSSFIVQKFNSNSFVYKLEDQVVVIESSRRLNKLSKITQYFEKGYEYYSLLLDNNLDLQRHRDKSKRRNFKIEATIDNIKDDGIELVNVTDGLNYNTNSESEKFEESNTTKLARRDAASDTKDKKPIGNQKRQRSKNKAYSASITKNNLISVFSYDIPVKGLLKDFLNDLFIDRSKNTEHQLFKIILLFGIISAQSYSRTINILFDKKDKIVADFKNDEFTTEIDKEYFAKNLNKVYFSDVDKTVQFYIPFLLSIALKQAKKTIKQDIEYYLNEEKEQEYHNFIKEKTKLFEKTIKIDTRRIHRISIAYLRDMGVSDITLMFCAATYSQNDISKLVYASIRKDAQYYTQYLEQLYSELEIDAILNKYLNLNGFKDSKKRFITDHREYTGSNLLIKKDVLTKFFHNLYFEIFNEHDKYKKFNYISIYIRVALSLLAGTRSFKNSANLDNISYHYGIMKISEKSETKIAGLRIIPLCGTMINLLKVYQDMCKYFNLKNNKFYIYYENKFNPLEVLNKSDKVGLHSTKALKNYSEELPAFVVDFLENVPLNFGRHLFTKQALEANTPRNYIDAYLAHYSAGLEQIGIYSTMDYKNYIKTIKSLTETLAKVYGVKQL